MHLNSLNCMFWPPCIHHLLLGNCILPMHFFVRWGLFMIDPYLHHLFHTLRFVELWNWIESLPSDIFLSFVKLCGSCLLCDWFSLPYSFFLSSIASMCFTSISLRCCNNFNMCHWLLCEFHILFCSLSLPTHQSMSMHYPISQLLDFCLNAFMLLHYLLGCFSLQVF